MYKHKTHRVLGRILSIAVALVMALTMCAFLPGTGTGKVFADDGIIKDDIPIMMDGDYTILKEISLTVEKVKCGTQVEVTEDMTVSEIRERQTPKPSVKADSAGFILAIDSPYAQHYEGGFDPFYTTAEFLDYFWLYSDDLFSGKLVPGACWVRIPVFDDYENGYSFDYGHGDLIRPQAYEGSHYISATKAKVNGKEAKLVIPSYAPPYVVAKFDDTMVEHDWDSGKVTKKPTVTQKGVKTYTCKSCGKTKTESIPTVGKKVSTAVVTTVGDSALKIVWGKEPGAAGYDVFMAKCSHDGKVTKPKKVKSLGSKKTSYVRKRLSKNTAYKVYVRAYKKVNGKKKYFTKSPTAHVFTSGGSGEFTNTTGVTVKRSKVTVRKGAIKKIKADVKKQDSSKKVMEDAHAPKLRYKSDNKKVATVSKSGKIRGKSPGTCNVYVIAANGSSRIVKVTVK